MFDPIFAHDCLRIGNQRWFLVLRRVYTAYLLLIFLWFTIHLGLWPLRTSPQMAAHQLLAYRNYLLLPHSFAILLFSCVIAVGGIAREKSQGTLELMLMSHLGAFDIVVGKWLARTAMIVAFTLPTVPLVVYLHVLLGQPLAHLLAWLACSWLFAATLAAAALLASVCLKHTTAALLAGYAATGFFTFALTRICADSHLMMRRHPFYDYSFEFWAKLLALLTLPSLAMIAVAVWRLRPTLEKERSAPARRGWFGGRRLPPLGDEPVRWRERHATGNRLVPLLGAAPRWLCVAVVVGVCFCLASRIRRYEEGHVVAAFFGYLGFFAIFAAVRSSAAISAEREAGTWEPLLLTGLTPREIVEQKARGVLDSIRPYWLASFVLTLPWLNHGGERFLGSVIIWVLCSLFVRLFAGCGIACSAGNASPWRSLLETLMWSVWFYFVIGLFAAPFSFLLTATLASACGLEFPNGFGTEWLWGAILLITFGIGVQLNFRDRLEMAILRIEGTVERLPLFTSWIHTLPPSGKRKA